MSKNREYTINLKQEEGGIELVVYWARSLGHYPKNIPTEKEDKEIVENLKGLMKKFKLTELNAQIEIK